MDKPTQYTCNLLGGIEIGSNRHINILLKHAHINKLLFLYEQSSLKVAYIYTLLHYYIIAVDISAFIRIKING